MLKPPRVGGADHLRLFVEELGFTWACQVIDVHPATMRAWLRGSRPVPAASMQALYWLTSYGFSEACSEAHWSHQWLCYKVRELENRLEAVRSGGAAVSDGVQALQGAVGIRLGPADALGDPGQVHSDGDVGAHARTQRHHRGQKEVHGERHFLPALL